MGTLSTTPASWNAPHTMAFSGLVSNVHKKMTQATQDQLILEHLSTVQFLARKMLRTLPAQVELEDLVAAGTLGLVDAAARFQPEAGVLFATFAQLRIRGAMLDSLRDMDWAPRELRRKGRAVQEAITTATRRLGRTPSDIEVAAAMGLAISDYQILLGELDGLEVGSLNVERGEESGEEEIAYVAGSPEDEPLFHCLRGEMKQRLLDAIEALPEKERTVITLYHYEELTMKEIGGLLEVAESRVSQLRSSAVLRLRAALHAGANTIPRKSARSGRAA